MNLPAQLIILFVLLLLSSFFSASETALTVVTQIQVRNMIKNNVKGAKTLAKLISNKEKLLSTILIGNNLVNIGASSLATSIAITLWGNSGIGIATGLMTLLVLIFGEITPKTLATSKSENVSLFVFKPIYFLTIVFSPFVYILGFITRFILFLFGVNSKDVSPIVTEEELLTIIDIGHEEGVFNFDEKELLNNVFNFDDLKAEDVMIPRADIVGVKTDVSYDEVMNLFRAKKFSKLSVYGEDLDDIKGIIHLKDMILFQGDKAKFNITKFAREPMFTFESKSISELFAQMRKEEQSLAVVIDEYGGTVGIITMHDMIEELVGDIEDEHKKKEFTTKRISQNELIVSGALHLDEFDEITGQNLEATSDAQTIAGFILELSGNIPSNNEIITYNDITFKILNISNNRIKRILVKL